MGEFTPSAKPLSFGPLGPRDDTAFRRFLRHFDWLLFFVTMGLCAIGLLMVYSASLRFGNPGLYLGKQIAAFAGGFMILFILSTLNYQIFSQHPKLLLLLSLSLLVLVLIVGKSSHGTKAWFMIGPIAFQPAEVCKLLTVLILGAWCERHGRELRHLRGLMVPFLVVLAHAGLILMQPDFGSTLVYLPILLAVLFVAGARIFHLFVILFFAAVAATVLLLHTYLTLSPDLLEGSKFLQFVHRSMTLGKPFLILQTVIALIFTFAWWFMKQMRFGIPGFYFASTYALILAGWLSSAFLAGSIKNYQRKRLIAFFNPEIDPLGSGYHVIQSVVALGSGKILGKGLFSSTQGRLGFLPEQHTDFIFSVLGEEMGFLVSGTVLLMYVTLLWRAVIIAGNSRDRFGSLVAVGIGTMFAFYAILNLAMVMGMAPVAGLPLPFLSYGGSSLFSSLAAVGILLSINARRYTY